MKRGDICLAAAEGDFGKVRPFVLVQNDALAGPSTPTYIGCPTTSDIQHHPFRVILPPTEESGLTQASEVMIDKVTVLRPSRIRNLLGRCSERQMFVIDTLLAFVLGLESRP